MRFPKEKIITTLIIFILLFLLTTVIVFSAGESPSLSARAAALYETSTQEFLYSKRGNERLPLASTTKIVTALVAIDSYPLDEEVSIVPEACGIEGSSLYLKPGETLSMRELLTALMLRSANDAAVAIAYAVAGGTEPFADMMNERVASLGLTDTHFTNPHGLDDKEHYTTARDLSLIAAEAMKNDAFKEICSLKKDKIINSDGDVRLVVNHNKLLRLYDGAIGVKTGFTKKSGRCLVGAAERDGIMLITVTLDAPDDWNDHAKMFDYGFSVMENRTVAKPGDFTYTVPVIGSDKDAVTVSNKEELKIILNKNSDKITNEVILPRYTASPITEGQKLGKVVFYKNGDIICELPLTADASAQKRENGGPFHRFKK